LTLFARFQAGDRSGLPVRQQHARRGSERLSADLRTRVVAVVIGAGTLGARRGGLVFIADGSAGELRVQTGITRLVKLALTIL
jgi:hypothetical protein